ncbi:serine/threonine-protein kinase [soil metagenome]
MSEGWGSAPQRFGRYAVRRRIGSGGFATVWLAYDEQLDAPVAVKVLAENWTDEHQVRTRFVEEGRYLRRVESPHVVTVYDAGELDDGRPYLVMTYADQGTLAERLEVGPLTVGQSLEVVRQVASGLQALHDRGILHRDVKPANVLFRTGEQTSGGSPGASTDRGEVRVMLGDLGLGKALDVSSRLTMIAGTPAFVAPEQAQGETPDARADQYSLAVVTYLLLAGRRTWDHSTLPSAAAPTPLQPMSTQERTFPREVEEVVARALSPHRERRFASVAEYSRNLDAAIGAWDGLDGTPGTRLLPLDPEPTRPGARPSTYSSDHGLPPLPEPVAPRGRRRWPRRVGVAVAALLALAAGGAGGYALQEQLRSEPELSADVTVTDDSGAVRVTVPRDWDASQSSGAWVPPNATDGRTYPGVSVGTSSKWADSEGPAEGVFAAVLPGSELPDQLPQHQECETAGDPVSDPAAGMGDTVTVVYSGCPDGYVVERVVQVNSSQLLWVQIRSEDRPTANRVLDGVAVIGL